jgi:UDP-GlcNAc:undecaprenyl-phosphate/decaprenyl-phosphate GlcNAc-1-phosphate transferase
VKILPLVFLTSFFAVLLATPSLIKVAVLKRLFDEPGDERKLHTRRIPTVGGVMIFAGTIFSFALWFPIEFIEEYSLLMESVKHFKYIVATILILFFVGIKDDIIGTAPVKKLIAHVIVGMVLVLMAEIRLTSLHGIFGVTSIPYWASVFLSLFTYIVVVNAFNLIDGVDGLAGGVGLIACTAFGAWFAIAGEVVMATLAFALSGSLLAFLIFNFQPAKIFMGDSGSLSIGLIICVLALKMIEFDASEQENITRDISKPVFAMAVLVYPLFDTLRIFIYRSLKGLSPFTADRNHLHHRLIDIGNTHRGTVIWIYTANIFCIALAVLTKDLQPSFSFLITGGAAILIAQIPFFIRKKKTTST